MDGWMDGWINELVRTCCGVFPQPKFATQLSTKLDVICSWIYLLGNSQSEPIVEVEFFDSACVGSTRNAKIGKLLCMPASFLGVGMKQSLFGHTI